MKNINIYAWASDFSDYTGEGLLARHFLLNQVCRKYKNYKIKIFSTAGVYFVKKKKFFQIKKKKLNNNFYTKYILQFYGILLIWYYYLRGKRTCYLNYLPLWNFLVFLFLPSNTILGPVTGNLYNKNIYSLDSAIRKIFFPIFFFISIKIIFNKFKFIIFGSNNLKCLIPKKFLKYTVFNYCLFFYNNRRIKKKTIDFSFYLRKRSTKSNTLIKYLIKKLCDNGFKVIVIGDNFVYKNVTNYNNIPRRNLLPIFDKTLISLNPADNLYSLFLLDSLSCNQLVFFDKSLLKKESLNKKALLIPIDFNNFNAIYKSMTLMHKKIIMKNKTVKNHNIFFKEQDELKKKIKTFSL
jgi:hypothetical protein